MTLAETSYPARLSSTVRGSLCADMPDIAAEIAAASAADECPAEDGRECVLEDDRDHETRRRPA